GYYVTMFSPDKLTQRSAQALQDSLTLAQSYQHSQIEPHHLFQALLNQSDTAVNPLLHRASVDLESLQQQLAIELNRLPTINQDATYQPSISKNLQQVL